jgi:predicted neuraminidase
MRRRLAILLSILKIRFPVLLLSLALLTAASLGKPILSAEHPTFVSHSPGAESPFYKPRQIFRRGEYGRQCHSSTITELSNGDLLAAWWSGRFEGSTDVVIKVARLRKGADSWQNAITASDIPERFEGNPVLFSVPDGRVWLFHVVSKRELPGRVQILFQESKDLGRTWSEPSDFVTRSGMRTRNHLIVMPNGEILFPLHDQRAGGSVFLISSDLGKAWEMSERIQTTPGNIQPTVVSVGGGELYALMRTWNQDPDKRFLWQSRSQDYGRTWEPATYSRVPTVSSAIEMVRLKNGQIVLAFNDGKERKRTPLNLALSSDGGRTWKHNRALETGEGSFSYPAIIQDGAGHIHVTYSYCRRFIKHLEVNEAWIAAEQQGAQTFTPSGHQAQSASQEIKRVAE